MTDKRSHQSLSTKNTGLLVVDVQTKLMPLMVQAEHVLRRMAMVIQSAQALDLPIILTEQYPKGLGHTVSQLRSLLPEQTPTFTKTSFSVLKDPDVQQALTQLSPTHWILLGIEAHICIQQSAKDLMDSKYGAIVLNDAISAGSVVELSTAIAEMRDCGVRVSCSEAILFELLGSSKHPAFKTISQIVKEYRQLQPVMVE